ncbi:MAG: NACHT domain-containing protein, partial [Clostridiales bacterium]|nr:NACHT domain-containing protein [Clostridiales bacterium]
MKNMLTPKKPQRIKPLKVKDWKDLIIDFSVAIVNGASVIAGIKSTEDALESWLNVIKDVGWETTEEELLWKLITRSMWRAIYKLVDESKSSFPLRTIAERKKLENRIQPRVVGIMNNRELNIDESFFLSPEKCGLMVDAQAFFKELLDGVIDPPQAESLVNRLPSFYVWELHDEWRAKADTYQPLYDYFKGSPFAKANTAEHEWERYRSFLQRQAQEAVFGSCFGLSQLYVPLNASYLETLQKNASNMKLLQENEAELRTHAMKEDAKQLIAVELESHLLNWLSKKNPRDAVRMVSGEPGAGKSSFAKIFAAKLANENNQKVLFIPLHRIDVSGNVIEAVGDYLLTDFTENPLKDPAANLLVIFDGLDELTETGRKYVEVAKDFVGRVDRQLIGLNRNNRCVSVLYTGRVLVTQSVQSFFESSQVLSLLPFFITESEKERYLDQNDLLEEDKRDVWWKKYGGLIGKQMSGIPESFNEERLAKLTAQPLLNYMIAITPEIYNSAAEAKSLNEIYAKLLSGIYRRDWDERQLRFLGGISEADYPLIFETIAVAAWHGMGRTVSVTEIEKVRDDGDFTIKWEAFQSGEEAGISN